MGLERHRVALVVKNQLLRAMEDVQPRGSRVIELNLRGTVPLRIIATHAPTAVDTEEEKDKYYEQLSAMMDGHGFRDTIILGDMNARLLHR